MDRRTFTALLGASAASISSNAFAQETDKTEMEPIVVPDMILGDENAPVTLVEYASYTCPHCATFHKHVMPDLRKNYIDTGKVKLIYREVYFDGPGLWAAMVARCGGGLKYFGVSGLLYERQREWTQGDGGAAIAQNLYKLGRIAGMNDADMEACLQDQEMAKAMVEKYQKDTAEDNVSSTPTLILNGENIGNVSYTELAKRIDTILG